MFGNPEELEAAEIASAKELTRLLNSAPIGIVIMLQTPREWQVLSAYGAVHHTSLIQAIKLAQHRGFWESLPS